MNLKFYYLDEAIPTLLEPNEVKQIGENKLGFVAKDWVFYDALSRNKALQNEIELVRSRLELPKEGLKWPDFAKGVDKSLKQHLVEELIRLPIRLEMDVKVEEQLTPLVLGDYILLKEKEAIHISTNIETGLSVTELAYLSESSRGKVSPVENGYSPLDILDYEKDLKGLVRSVNICIQTKVNQTTLLSYVRKHWKSIEHKLDLYCNDLNNQKPEISERDFYMYDLRQNGMMYKDIDKKTELELDIDNTDITLNQNSAKQACFRVKQKIESLARKRNDKEIENYLNQAFGTNPRLLR